MRTLLSSCVCVCVCVSPEEKLWLCLTRQTVWADTVRGHHSRRTHLASEGCCSTLKIFLSCFSYIQCLLRFILCQHTSTSALSTVLKLTSKILLLQSSNLIPHHKAILFCNCDNMFPTEASTFQHRHTCLTTFISTLCPFPTWLRVTVTSAKANSPVLPAVQDRFM